MKKILKLKADLYEDGQLECCTIANGANAAEVGSALCVFVARVAESIFLDTKNQDWFIRGVACALLEVQNAKGDIEA